MRQWWQHPVLHFVLIGGLLFVTIDLIPTLYEKYLGEGEQINITISTERLRELRSDYIRQTGFEPTNGALQAMIQQAFDDEVLYREARRLRLDFGDRSIRKRLIQKMRAVSTDPKQSEDDLYHEALALGFDDDLVVQRLLREKMRMLLRQEPNGIEIREQDIAYYIERHRDQFLQPATVSFSHVFLRGQPDESRLLGKAKMRLAKLRTQLTPPETAVKHSDAFLLGQQFQAQTLAQITRHFGSNFADAVFSLPSGKWSDPIASSYGLHLVWVSGKDSGTLPPRQAVWKQASQGLLEERSAANLAIGLRKLRELYKVNIEEDQSGAGQAASLRGNS